MLFYILLYLLFLFVVFYKSKLYIKSPNTHFIDKQNTNSVKVFCAWGVVLHHIANEVDCGKMLFPFMPIGFMLVAVFFFFSGYGLVVSKNKNTSYLDSFLKKRILTILIPYTIALIVYCAYYLFTGGLEFTNILKQFIGASPVVRNSWFIIVLLYLYILFWLCFKFLKNNTISNIVFYFILSVILIFRFIPHWSPALIAFIFGCIFADRYKIFSNVFLKYSWIVGILSFFLVGVLFVIKTIRSSWFDSYLDMAISFSFVSAVLFIVTRISFSNIIITMSGKILFEIYLYHGIIMLILNKIDYIKGNVSIYIILTITSTILISIVAYYVKRFICVLLGLEKSRIITIKDSKSG